MEPFWLYEWMDRNRIITPRDAQRAVRTRRLRSSLLETAATASVTIDAAGDRDDSPILVAGTGLDLSGNLDCSHPECLQKQVDHLFRKAWLYYDRIVVQDVLGNYAEQEWDGAGKSARWTVAQWMSLVLHLRSIGAQELLTFRRKPWACSVHWRAGAQDAGVRSLPAVVDDAIALLEREATYGVNIENGRVAYKIDHPTFEHSAYGSVAMEKWNGAPSDAERKRLMIASYVNEVAAYLVSDCASARMMSGTLGSTIQLHRRFLAATTRAIGADDVLLELDLPILENVDVGDLIRVRRDERDHLERFRLTVRSAATQLVKGRESGDVTELAKNLRADVIDPELMRIRDRLGGAQRALQRKTAASVWLGVITTTCGLTGGGPIVGSVGCGVAAMLTQFGTAVGEHLNAKSDIEQSSMFLLWEASKHRA